MHFMFIFFNGFSFFFLYIYLCVYVCETPSKRLEPRPLTPPTSTYTCRVTITPRACSDSLYILGIDNIIH